MARGTPGEANLALTLPSLTRRAPPSPPMRERGTLPVMRVSCVHRALTLKALPMPGRRWKASMMTSVVASSVAETAAA